MAKRTLRKMKTVSPTNQEPVASAKPKDDPIIAHLDAVAAYFGGRRAPWSEIKRALTQKVNGGNVCMRDIYKDCLGI